MQLEQPEEKLRQVMAWYPNKKFYKRPSDKSGKQIISVYSPESPCPVYSHDEWYSDDWDTPFLEPDFDRPFFSQWQELQKKAPVVSLFSNLQENAEYCQDVEGLKNCYIVFDAINCQDVYYSVRIYNSKSCVDVYWVIGSELLYECVYMYSCHNCRYSFNCEQSSDSAFLFNCRNVQKSFMCSNLRNKKYCFMNKQLSKEEYEKKISEYNLSDTKQVDSLKPEFQKMIQKTPVPKAFLENCEDSSGNYLKNCKNVKRGFECFDLRDCRNVFQCASGKDIEDSFMCNDRVERCFQCVATGIGSYQTMGCAFTWKSANMQYCYLCISCQDCFGCIGLRNKRYHIFNKPYSKKDYFETIGKLIEKMKQRGEYANFFPLNLSPFPYKDTIAWDFFEKKSSHISQSPLQHIPQELKFYEVHRIPIPQMPFQDRYRARIRMMDTGFQEKNGVYIKHPEEKNIVEQKEYEQALR